MPGSAHECRKLAAAVQEAASVKRSWTKRWGILRVVLKAAENRREKADFDREHHALARKAAAESIVL